MNVFKNLIIATALILVTGLSFAANPAKGIYADTAEGLKQCLSDRADGKAVDYVPTLDNPIVSKKFDIKKVGQNGACLTKARVTGDDGKGMQVATVSVSPAFEYGIMEKNGTVVEYRMKACSNHFDSIHFPAAKVVEKKHEPTPVPPPVKVAEPAPVPVVVQPAPAATCTTCREGFVVTSRTPRTDGKCITVTNVGYRIQITKDGKSNRLVARLVDANISPIPGSPVVYVGNANVSGDCVKDEDSLIAAWEQTRAGLLLPPYCEIKSLAAKPS